MTVFIGGQHIYKLVYRCIFVGVMMTIFTGMFVGVFILLSVIMHMFGSGFIDIRLLRTSSFFNMRVCRYVHDGVHERVHERVQRCVVVF